MGNIVINEITNRYMDKLQVRNSFDLYAQGRLTEVRLIPTDKSRNIYSMYTDSAEVVVDELEKMAIDGKLKNVNVYVVPQIVNESCRSRSQYNHFQKNVKSTSNRDIDQFQWIILDFDVDAKARNNGSSTKKQLKGAKECCIKVWNEFVKVGVDGFIAMSGNGYHLIYKIAPTDEKEKAKKIIENFIKALNISFSASLNKHNVQIDTSLAKPAQPIKLYGTLAQKGEDTPETPHRISRLESIIPDEIQVLPWEYVKAISNEHKPPEEARREVEEKQIPNTSGIDFTKLWEDYLHNLGIHIYYTALNSTGDSVVFRINCIFDSNHKQDARIIVNMTTGKWGYYCWHEHCKHNATVEFLEQVDPEKALFNKYIVQPQEQAQKKPKIDTTKKYYCRLSEVEKKEVEWLISGYIPKDNITILAGDGGVSKGLFWSNLIAGLSSGQKTILDEVHPFDTERDIKKILVLSPEDSTDTVLVDRFEQAGAMMENIYTLHPEVMSELTTDSEDMERIIEDLKPDVVIIDPLQCFLGSNVDMSRRNHIRKAMQPLKNIAEKHHTTIIIICHANKSSNAGRQRIADSADIWDIARSVLMLGRTSSKKCYVSHEKCNYSKPEKSIIYDISDNGRLKYIDTCDKKDSDFIAEKRYNSTAEVSSDLLNEAKSLIAEYLEERPDGADNGEVENYVKSLGVSQKKYTQAKRALTKDGVIITYKKGYGESWGLKLK